MRRSFKSSFKNSLETRRIRLRRHSGDIYRDVRAGVLLTGIVGVATLLVVAGYFVLTSAPWFRMDKTIINGCGKVSNQEILALTNVKPGQALFYLNTDKMIRQIKTNPWIENVLIRRDLPGKLIIDVKERHAVALMRKDQTLYFVDTHATPFKKIGEKESADLPILTGFSENGIDKTEMIKKSLELLTFFSGYDGFPRAENISEVQADDTAGFLILADNGISILMGFGRYTEKLGRLKAVMADLARREMTGRLFIDLSDPSKITVQRKEAPAFPQLSRGYRT